VGVAGLHDDAGAPHPHGARIAERRVEGARRARPQPLLSSLERTEHDTANPFHPTA
jgi:hypothetical protein